MLLLVLKWRKGIVQRKLTLFLLTKSGLIISVLFQPEGVIIQDERESRKLQLLQVAQRVQSEYSFRYVASGSASKEDLSGLLSTDE